MMPCIYELEDFMKITLLKCNIDCNTINSYEMKTS